MGEPKLLLPVAGRPLIVHTLGAWLGSRVDQIVVVVRPGDHNLTAVLDRAAESKVQGPKSKVDLVIPDVAPPDMKASVQAALRHIEGRNAPTVEDAFLLAPADMPGLSAAIADRLIERSVSAGRTRILAPTIDGKRGHPVLFPWPFAAEVFALGDGEGLNTVVESHPPQLVACEDLVASGEHPFADIDTPEEYQQANKGK